MALVAIPFTFVYECASSLWIPLRGREAHAMTSYLFPASAFVFVITAIYLDQLAVFAVSREGIRAPSGHWSLHKTTVAWEDLTSCLIIRDDPSCLCDHFFLFDQQDRCVVGTTATWLCMVSRGDRAVLFRILDSQFPDTHMRREGGRLDPSRTPPSLWDQELDRFGPAEGV